MDQHLLDFLEGLYAPSPAGAGAASDAKQAFRRYFQSLGVEYCNYGGFEAGPQGIKVSEFSDTNMDPNWIEEYLYRDLAAHDYVMRRSAQLSASRPYDCFEFGSWIPAQLDEDEAAMAEVLLGCADAGMEDGIGLVGYAPVAPDRRETRFFGFGFGGAAGTNRLVKERLHELTIATFALIDRLRPELEAAADGFTGQLTARERDVLRGLADGLHRDQIAFRLNIALPTVDLHAGNLRRKLRAQTLAEAVAKGYRYGLL